VVLGVAVLRAPLDLFDPGLALSYGATLALLIGGEKSIGYFFRRRETGKRARHVVALGVATVCAEVAVLPIGALAFGRVTAAGLLLNFLAIPSMAVVQLAGLGLTVFDAAVPPLAELAALVARLGTNVVLSSTTLVAEAPWLTWRVSAPPAWAVVAYYAGCAAALTVPRWRRSGIAAALVCGGVIASPVSLPGLTTDTPAPNRTLRVTVLDVGQGDAVVVDLPSGRRVLVDTGGLAASTFDVGGRVVGPAIVALGARRLHAIAITHPDPDHIGGAAAVLRDFRPLEIWEGVPVPVHPARRALAAQAARLGAGWRMLRRGDRLREGAVEIDVLHPPPPDWERQRVRNDDSIVLDVRLGNVSIVLPGDVGRGVEQAIIPLLRPAAIRILKAAHHGSATSTSPAFLRATRPAAVIFSAGRDNRYGHPAAAVLARVRASGAVSVCTCEEGAVSVETDGRSATLSTVGGRRRDALDVKALGTGH
jgi:competence protein ComEC